MATWEYCASLFGPYFVIFIVCIGHTSFFLISVTLSWTSPVLAKLGEAEDNPLGRPITTDESDLIGSLFFVGASVGPLLFIHIVKKFGRKKVLVLLLTIVPIAYGMLIFVKKVEYYYLSRILLGLYSGATLSVVPVYLSEIIAPDDVAFLMSFETLFGFTGILITYTLGSFIPLKYFNGSIVVFSVIVIILLSFGCPESPYYMMQVKGKDEARRVLRRLRKQYIEKELEHIEKTIENETSKSYFEIFKSKKYFKTIILATIPLLLQQFCGITLIVTYSQLIFQETKLPLAPHICSIIVVGLLEVTCFLAPTLLKSKRLSLKNIMTLSLAGTAICNLVISIYFFYGKNLPALNWVPLVSLILFVVFFNCGMDPIAWTILGQTYPRNISFVGTALSTSVYFISIFPILYSFYKVDMTYLFLGSFFSCTFGVIYVRFIFEGSEKKVVEDIHLQKALI
ncbi:facilitated trehalose transporter Tret1-like [Coccinella septempunctata]|uniref:facilitated trehalose transporter Tret1-like n=1 Tax=Coccinella septempunctata TaxID=41139 RepID=UPI001D08BEEC|nr:facilitated trehalose transporter Tret1-like [Coccinella septempunctata]